MAIRIHVTAVRDCPTEALRASLSKHLGPSCIGNTCPPGNPTPAVSGAAKPIGELLPIREHDGWTWTVSSVWAVAGSDLNAALIELGRPGVQFTTSDGDRWYLTVHGGADGPASFCHEFSLHERPPDPTDDERRADELARSLEPEPVDPRLAFLEEPPEPAARPPSPFDEVAQAMAERGAALPEDFLNSLTPLPYSAAVDRYRHWHAERVAEAMLKAGVPHDGAGLRAALLWESTSDNERAGDLGNLPSVLKALGIVGLSEEERRPAQATPAQPPQAEPIGKLPDAAQPSPTAPPQAEDGIDRILALVSEKPLQAVRGGPVSLPVSSLERLIYFIEAFSLNSVVGAALTVLAPAGAAAWKHGSRPLLTRGASGYRTEPDRLVVVLSNHLWMNKRDMKQMVEPAVAKSVLKPADGSTLEVAFASEDRPWLTQRYRGQVHAGVWAIAETSPAFEAATLAGALEFARNPYRDNFRFENQAEADAVLEQLRLDPSFQGTQVNYEKGRLSCETGFGPELGKAVFRHRFGGPWGMADYTREATRRRRERHERKRSQQRAMIALLRKRQAPTLGPALFRGSQSWYWRSDFSLLETLEQQTREAFDQDVLAAGYRPLGDLVAKKCRDLVLRVYLSTDGTTYAMLTGGRSSYFAREFVTRFDDASSLCTTTYPAVASRPEAGVFYKCFPDLTTPELLKKHHWGIERFLQHRGAKPIQRQGTLRGFAEDLERAFANAAGAANAP